MASFALPKSLFILFYYLESFSILYENIVIKVYIARSTKEKNEQNPETKQNNDLTIFYGCRSLGILLIMPLSGLMIQFRGPRLVFGVMSVSPIILFITTLLLKERDYEMNQGDIVVSRDFKSVLKLFKM